MGREGAVGDFRELGRAGRSHRGRAGGEPETAEDRIDDLGLLDGGDQAHAAAAGCALQDIADEHPLHQRSPREAAGAQRGAILGSADEADVRIVKRCARERVRCRADRSSRRRGFARAIRQLGGGSSGGPGGRRVAAEAFGGAAVARGGSAPGSRGRQYAVVPDLVGSGWRDQSHESLEKLDRLEDHVSRAVAPAALETVVQASVGQTREAAGGHRGSSHVAAQALQALAVQGRDADVGVQAHAADRGAALAQGAVDLVYVDAIAETRDAPARAWPGGGAVAHRSGVELPEHAVTGREWIRLCGAGLEQVAALEQPDEPTGDRGDDGFHVSVSRRG